MEAQKQVEDRAAPLQTNRSHLTDEERHENNRRSKYNWYLNHKDYFKPGGHGYACIMKRTLCPCGREVYANKLKRHQSSRRCTLNSLSS